MMRTRDTKLSPIFLLLFLLVVILFGISVANAGTATVTITPPTTRTDGSTITGALTYQYDLGTCPSLSTVSQTKTTTATSWTFTAPPGTYCARAYAIETGGGTSGPSNIGTKTIVIAPPNPPVITISGVGLTLRSFPDGFLHLAVDGTVPIGAPCTLLNGDLEWLGAIAGGKLAVCGPG